MDKPKSDDSFLTGSNASYISDLYDKWIENPKIIDDDWSDLFNEFKVNGSLSDIPKWARSRTFESDKDNKYKTSIIDTSGEWQEKMDKILPLIPP